MMGFVGCAIVIQLFALYRKNALLAMRSPVTTILQLGAPMLCLGAVVALSWALEQNDFVQTSALGSSNLLSPPKQVGHLPNCNDSLFLVSDCVQFVYAPNNNSAVQDVVNGIRRFNSPRIDPNKVVGLRTLEDMDVWFMTNPGRAMAGLFFDIDEADDTVPTRFVIQTNSTIKVFKGRFQDPNFYVQLPLQQAVEREIFRALLRQQVAESDDSGSRDTDGSSDATSPALDAMVNRWQYEFQDVPRRRPSPSGEATATPQSHSVLAPFIFAASMLSFGITMSAVVHESSDGLKTMLRTAGMSGSAYWLSWLMWDLTMAAMSALVFCGCGVGLKIGLFTRNSLVLVATVFFLFQSSMACLAYLLSWSVQNPRSATHLSFGIFILGWICQIVISFGYPYSPTTKESQPASYVALSLMPWDILAKALMDLGEAAQSISDNGGAAAATFATSGISWDSRYSYCRTAEDDGSSSRVAGIDAAASYHAEDCVMSLGECLEWLLAEALGLFVVVLTLEMCQGQMKGLSARASRYFAKQSASSSTTPSAGVAGPVDKSVAAEEDRLRAIQKDVQGTASSHQDRRCKSPCGHETDDPTHTSESMEDGDADNSQHGASSQDEHEGAQQQYSGSSISADDNDESVQVFGISKKYRGGFQALRPLWCSLRRSEVFCLLGSNGAGKTTTINILTGVSTASEGEAYVEGKPVSTDLTSIRSFMGVCPQFDVLWPLLTGREHMQLYTAVKGANDESSNASANIERHLGAVGLLDAADVRTGCYSGGMQRRLSLALALLGDPKIAYLDEPTTGMDPINRRCVWNVIQSTKPGKSIVLTTHSLEEADVLGDQMAIMAAGQLQSIGTGLALKRRFGAGYRVLITFMAESAGPGGRTLGLPPAEARERLRRVRTNVKHAIIQRVMVLMTLEESPHSLQFRVPRESDEALCDLLEHLESNAGSWGIHSIDVSLPTLEEVFLEVLASVQTKAEDDEWPAVGSEPTP